MNKAESDRIHQLCSLIAVEAVEKDRDKFLRLVEELNMILATKGDRLQNNQLNDQERK